MGLAVPLRHNVLVMETELIDSFERFRAALMRHTEQADAEQPDRIGVMSSADEVLVARLDFYRCLVHAGWTPPPDVLQILRTDRALYAEPDDRDLDDGEASVSTGRLDHG